MAKEKRINGIWILILSLLFGFIAGFISYLAFSLQPNLPIVRDLYFTDPVAGGEVIIQSPRRVIVEQDQAIAQTVESIQSSIVQIYPAATAGSFFTPNQALGQGFIYTTDGWIVTNADFSLGTADNYVVITSKNEVLPVQEIKRHPKNLVTLFKVDQQNLPAVDLQGRDEQPQLGQLLLAVTKSSQLELVSLSNLKVPIKPTIGYVFTSDNFNTAPGIDGGEDLLPGTPIFSLNRKVVGFIGQNQTLSPTIHWQPKLNDLINDAEDSSIVWGIRFYDLSLVARDGADSGAYIVTNGILPTSPVFNMLQSGDIITAVDDQLLTVNRDLAEILSGYKPGDKVEFTFIRDNKQERQVIEIPR